MSDIVQDERDKRLDQLALRISEVLDGENQGDIVSVTAMLCAYSLCEYYGTPAERWDGFRRISKFMHGIIDHWGR